MASALPLMAALILQQQGFYNQVIPKTTGENGYEEYVLAAELAEKPAVRAYFAWQPRQDSAQVTQVMRPAEAAALHGLIGKTPLQAKRQLMRENSRILDLIRRGNAKPVLDPRGSVDLNTLFPELSGLRAAARVSVASSDALLADGRSAEAARVLGDALKMGANIQHGTLLPFLVGSACQAVVLGGINNQLDRYSEGDWKVFAAVTTELLERPNPVQPVLQSEARVVIKTLRQMVKDLTYLDVITPTGEEELAERIRAMSGIERARLIQDAEREITRTVGDIEQVLRQPESKWGSAPRPKPATDAERLSDFAMTVTDQTLVAHARLQLRLLRLHALVQIYRWNWNELPTSLDQAAGRAELSDPLTEGDFNYERTSTGYRLYSKGSEATGEIELRYRRPQGGTSGAEAPPK